MQKVLSILIAAALLGLTGMAFAQQNDSHTSTVTISSVNAIDVDNPVILIIDAAVAGSQPTSVSDATTANLLWTTNAANRKIMVKTVAALPDGVTLSSEAQGLVWVGGSGSPASAGTVVLTAADQNFITGAGKRAGTCDLNYTASATVDAVVQANDVTVIYTFATE